MASGTLVTQLSFRLEISVEYILLSPHSGKLTGWSNKRAENGTKTEKKTAIKNIIKVRWNRENERNLLNVKIENNTRIILNIYTEQYFMQHGHSGSSPYSTLVKCWNCLSFFIKTIYYITFIKTAAS